MAKLILVSYDFAGNEIQNALAHVLATAPTALGAGQIYFDTTIGKLGIYNGASWDYQYALNDSGTAITDLWSADKIASEIASAVTGGMDYIGGYNAATNTPDLDTSPSGISSGDTYTVTADGTFFTEPVTTGDFLIAEQDNPTTLAHWTVLERNLNPATESSQGTTQIATQAEVTTGTDDFKYITPLKLATDLAAQGFPNKFAVDLDGAGEASVVRAFAGGVTTWTVTHNLNALDTTVQVKEIASGEEVTADIDNTTVNILEVKANGNIADDVYRVTIIG